jgi:hypothetical protein
LLCRIALGLVGVAHGKDLHLQNGQEGAQVVTAATAEADESHRNAFTWGHTAGLPQARGLGEWDGRDCRRGMTQKSPARNTHRMTSMIAMIALEHLERPLLLMSQNGAIRNPAHENRYSTPRGEMQRRREAYGAGAWRDGGGREMGRMGFEEQGERFAVS